MKWLWHSTYIHTSTTNQNYWETKRNDFNKYKLFIKVILDEKLSVAASLSQLFSEVAALFSKWSRFHRIAPVAVLIALCQPVTEKPMIIYTEIPIN